LVLGILAPEVASPLSLEKRQLLEALAEAFKLLLD
jgi:hypothetical protein